MSPNKLFTTLAVLILLLLSGCYGKHNIPIGPIMSEVAIEYDASLLVAKCFGLHDKAEPGFRRVLGWAPRFAEAHYNLAIALAHQAKWGEALAEFKQALLITPDFELALMGRDVAHRMLDNELQSTDIEIPRYCRYFSELYELGC